MTMQRPTTKRNRKRRFVEALSYAGLTQEAWAEQAGVTYYHLYLVLKGERKSVPLTAKVDAFIDEQSTLAAAEQEVAA